MNSGAMFSPQVMAALEAVKVYRPVVVGGYLRDYFHGVPPKDVDVFFCSPLAQEHALVDLLRSVSVLMARTVLGGSAELAQDRNIAAIEEVMLTDLSILQLIYPVGAVTPEGLVDSVDFGLCRVGWSFETGLIITDAYRADDAARQFTLLIDNPERRERALTRFARFKEKYPDFKLVIPGEAVPA